MCESFNFLKINYEKKMILFDIPLCVPVHSNVFRLVPECQLFLWFMSGTIIRPDAEAGNLHTL